MYLRNFVSEECIWNIFANSILKCLTDMMISFLRWGSMLISIPFRFIEITWLVMTFSGLKQWFIHFWFGLLCFQTKLVTFSSNSMRFVLCPWELWPSETISVLTCFPRLSIVSLSSKIIITPYTNAPQITYASCSLVEP